MSLLPLLFTGIANILPLWSYVVRVVDFSALFLALFLSLSQGRLYNLAAEGLLNRCYFQLLAVRLLLPGFLPACVVGQVIQHRPSPR